MDLTTHLLAIDGEEKFSSKRGDCGWRLTVVLKEDRVVVVTDFEWMEAKAFVVTEDGTVYTIRRGVMKFGKVTPEFYRKYREYLRGLKEYITTSKYDSDMVSKVDDPLEKELEKLLVWL